MVLAETTRDRYLDLIRIYIRPTFGSLPASKIDVEILERFYARLQRCKDMCSGRQRGHTCRPLAGSTVRRDSADVSVGVLTGARIDTAAAWLLCGDLDAARAHLGSALSLTPDAGNVSLGGRLANVRTLLGSPRWEGEPAAGELASEVEQWLRSA